MAQGKQQHTQSGQGELMEAEPSGEQSRAGRAGEWQRKGPSSSSCAQDMVLMLVLPLQRVWLWEGCCVPARRICAAACADCKGEAETPSPFPICALGSPPGKQGRRHNSASL